MIYQSGFGRSRLPEANCLLLKKGCRQAFLVQGGSQRQKQTTFTGPPRSSTTFRRTTLFVWMCATAACSSAISATDLVTCVRSWLSDLFTYSAYLSIMRRSRSLIKAEYPRSGSDLQTELWQRPLAVFAPQGR